MEQQDSSVLSGTVYWSVKGVWPLLWGLWPLLLPVHNDVIESETEKRVEEEKKKWKEKKLSAGSIANKVIEFVSDCPSVEVVMVTSV